MASKRTWASYPATYQAREVAIIAEWIAVGESGAIIGPHGSGKSNLLGFLSHRPEVLTPYLPPNYYQLAVVLVDLNNLPGSDLSTFYRIILRALYESRSQFLAIQESLADTIETLYRDTARETDPFVTQSALREALLAIQDNEARLVLVLDPFDRFVQTANPQILDNLRGLRDSLKITLSYLVGIQQELAYLRDPTELGELYQLLDLHGCWVGGMTAPDARYVINNMLKAKGEPFKEAEIEQLIALTGGYAAFLKGASLWLTKVSPPPPFERWLEALLAEPSLQHRLQALWQGLTGEEQLALAELQALPDPKKSSPRYREFCQQYAKTLTRLQEKRICQIAEEWQIFSPLLGAYIQRLGLIEAGKIHHRERDDVILQGQRSLERELTPQDRRLLIYFLKNPQKVLSKDDIARALWSDSEISDQDKGIDDARLHKAVSQLRRVLEKSEGSPCYLKTVHGVGYRFFPEGAPRNKKMEGFE